MGPERHDRPRDGEDDDFDEHDSVADAYSPPPPGPNAGRSTFLLGVLAVVVLCVVVFAVALALR